MCCVCVCGVWRVCVCVCARVCVMGCAVSQKFPKSQLFVSARTGGRGCLQKMDRCGQGGRGLKKAQTCADILYR